MDGNSGKDSALLRRGVSIRRLNYILAGITLVISVLLLIATYRARLGYGEVRSYTENYIHWQSDAYELQLASDYLTEQVRCFAETGDSKYLDAYFEEAKVTRRRDKALEHLKDYMGEAEAYESLEAAMRESVLLMDREYYSMRLVVEAMDYPLTEFPEEIVSVALRGGDAALSPELQTELARQMVFDQIYHDRKTAIGENMDACVSKLAAEIQAEQVATADRLERLMDQERLLIIILIIVSMLSMLFTLLLVISPLLRAVVLIRAEKPLPVKGSYEFRFLAKTYNLMYEATREKEEQLAYEATHDKLTGAYNRSGYDFLTKNVDLESSALLIADVDKFKTFNDTYGHEIGDKVLRLVACSLKGAFRSQDYVCRIGGDEFVVIMVNAANARPETVQKKIAKVNRLLEHPREEGVPPISLSCGVTFGKPGAELEELFNAADAALYEVKHSGGKGCRAG